MFWRDIDKNDRKEYIHQRICGSHMILKRFEKFIDTFGIDQVSFCTGDYDLPKILKGDGFRKNLKMAYPPFDDHGAYYRKSDSNRIYYVYHPMVINLQKLEDWCNSHDLIYIVCKRSVSFCIDNFRGNYMVLLMSNDSYVDTLSINSFPNNWEIE